MNAPTHIETLCPRVYQAIANVTHELGIEGIGKNRKNDQQGYKFRGIDDVYNALSSALSKFRLCIIPRVLERTQDERMTANNKPIFYTTVKVEYRIVSAEDGSNDVAIAYGEAMDSADKSTNKAMSAAYKYMAMQLFCIPTEGDNDADAHTHEIQSRARPSQPTELDRRLALVPDVPTLHALWKEIEPAQRKEYSAKFKVREQELETMVTQ